jgi:hypothetical protein
MVEILGTLVETATSNGLPAFMFPPKHFLSTDLSGSAWLSKSRVKSVLLLFFVKSRVEKAGINP